MTQISKAEQDRAKVSTILDVNYTSARLHFRQAVPRCPDRLYTSPILLPCTESNTLIIGFSLCA